MVPRVSLTIKQRFWLFKRGSVYCLQDSQTGKKDSLGTGDLKQAERLRAAKNEAGEKPLLGLTLGKAYLSAYDPKLVERKWAQVMDEFGQRGRDSSRARYARALKSPVLAAFRDKKIVDTTPDDFRAALADNKPSTNHFLRRVHDLAVGMGWLPWPIIPTKMWLAIHLRTTKASARSAEFCRRCRVAKIKGVSLHSYRYDWAERARACGYPERWAQNALGHNSRAVHEAYAKSAIALCPPL